MSPELQGRIKQEEQAVQLTQQASPVCIIFDVPGLGANKKFSGTLVRLVMGSGITKLTVSMLIDEAVDLISALCDSSGAIDEIEMVGDIKEVKLCGKLVHIKKSVLKDIDHLVGVCRVFIDIA